MDAVATIPQQPVFFNLEYFFFLAYKNTAGFFNHIFSEQFFHTLQIVATILVILLITGILYLLVLLYEFKYGGAAKKKEAAPEAAPAVGLIPAKNETWEKIRTKVLSDTPSEWRIGIIEADIYLDKSLDLLGYYGDTLGDKLKKMTETQLPSIQLAWSAHKVRNMIAHEGGDFVLTMPEARRTLSYYEIVFRELGLID